MDGETLLQSIHHVLHHPTGAEGREPDACTVVSSLIGHMSCPTGVGTLMEASTGIQYTVAHTFRLVYTFYKCHLKYELV
jgi:hypothetical protein